MHRIDLRIKSSVQCLRFEIISLLTKLATYNPQQGIWNKKMEFSKIGQDKSSLISTFARF